MLHEEILKLVNMISDGKLRMLVLDLLENPYFKLSGNRYSPMPLEGGRGSINHHHSYRGGLLEHIIACSKLGLALCRIVEEVYGFHVNRDVVLASTLTHDIYKTVIYDEGSPTGLSPLGEMVDHHTLVVSELMKRGFPPDVIHAVLAIHGRYGPLTPKTLEALIAHLADQLDSTLCDKVLKAAKNLIKVAAGVEPETLTAREAFTIILAKQKGGWNALKELGKTKNL